MLHKKQYTFLYTMLLLILPVLGISQLQWVNVDAEFGPLPTSVHVYKTTSTLNGKPNIAYYLQANLKDLNIDFTAQSGRGERFTPTQFYQKENKPLVVVNCTFFSFATNQNLNLIMRQGSLLAYNLPATKGKNDSLYRYLSRSAIGISKNRNADVAWLYTDTATRYPFALTNGPSTAFGPNADPTWPQLRRQLKGGIKKKSNWKMETAVGGGPVLLQMGKKAITNVEENMFATGLADKHPRTAMGYTKSGDLIILMVEGRNPGIAEGASLTQMADIFHDLGCWEALNLDGGGSSTMIVNGKETIKPSDKEGQRPVPGVFLIYKR